MARAAIALVQTLKRQIGEQSGASLERLVALSGSDSPFLTEPTDAGFCTAWPADLPLETEGFTQAFLDLAAATQKMDPRVQKRSNRLVPKKTTEPLFWRNYFGHAHAVINGLEMAPPAAPAAAAPAATSQPSLVSEPDLSHLSDEELKSYVDAKLPPPRKPAERRFAAAEPLQTSGELKAVQMLGFVTKAEKMVCDRETAGYINAAAERGGMMEASMLLLQFQLELMENVLSYH